MAAAAGVEDVKIKTTNHAKIDAAAPPKSCPIMGGDMLLATATGAERAPECRSRWRGRAHILTHERGRGNPVVLHFLRQNVRYEDQGLGTESFNSIGIWRAWQDDQLHRDLVHPCGGDRCHGVRTRSSAALRLAASAPRLASLRHASLSRRCGGCSTREPQSWIRCRPASAPAQEPVRARARRATAVAASSASAAAAAPLNRRAPPQS